MFILFIFIKFHNTYYHFGCRCTTKKQSARHTNNQPIIANEQLLGCLISKPNKDTTNNLTKIDLILQQ